MLQEANFSFHKSERTELSNRQTTLNPFFSTGTDSDVLAKLRFFVYNQFEQQTGRKPSFLTVIANALKHVEGAFVALFKSSFCRDEIVASRFSLPLLLGLKYPGGAIDEHFARAIEIKADGPFVHIAQILSVEHLELPTHNACELFIAFDAPDLQMKQIEPLFQEIRILLI
jgi:glucosamine 6-phosphate synthetase-like amidotransferase/phosphosugar isomerase protein